jgi:hypothetical protein
LDKDAASIEVKRSGSFLSVQNHAWYPDRFKAYGMPPTDEAILEQYLAEGLIEGRMSEQ